MYIARKRMTIAGVEYHPRARVPLDEMPEKIRRQLIGQRKVLFEAPPEEIETESKPKLRLKKRSK